MHWQVLQMKTSPDPWDQHLDRASLFAHEDGDETVLDTQDWYWGESYEA